MSDAVLLGLKKQRSTNKAKLTNLVKYARQDHNATEVGELNTRLRRVEQLMAEFTELELKIFTECSTEESDLTYEENYYTAISSLNTWIRSKTTGSGVIDLDMSHNATQNGEHSQVKLPKIHIPSFSGDYAEWQSFYDMYMTIIHESQNLNQVQKFQYLKGLLRGEAGLLLRHITVTEGNYIGALNKLKERYDRKKHIINTFIRTFVEQPSVHISSASSIKRIMDTSDEVIRGLQALGATAETRDPWLIYILLQKLDDKSKTLWAEHSADILHPEFAEFLKFLGRRIDTLESLQSTSKRPISRGTLKNHVGLSDPEHEIESHVVSNPVNFECYKCQHRNCTTQQNAEPEVESHAAVKPLINIQCAMCQHNDHTTFQCKEFQSLDVNGRKEVIKRSNRCFNCLSATHPIFRCPSRRRCQRCGKKHNTLLHQDNYPAESQNTQPTSVDDTQNLHSQSSTASVILPTAVINALDAFGKLTSCRALLDSGSQASFITEACAQRLHLKKRNARITVRGLGQASSVISKGLVTIKIRPLEIFSEFSIDALVISKITNPLPAQSFDMHGGISSNIKLADPQFNKRSNIDVLIGAEHFFDLIKDGQIKSCSNEPILQNTVFGWIVSGQSTIDYQEPISMLTTSEDETEGINIDLNLRRFWELETIDSTEKKLSPEEEFCENHFVGHLERNSQGRLITKLPFKVSPKNLGESLGSAIQRLNSVERRFVRDPMYSKLYHDFMAEYEELGHMVEIPATEASKPGYYLPHHGVLKKSSTTSKMRVVFDGSAKSSTGISLNDCLAVGPTVQSSLYAIILRFREFKVAFSADVEKMYRQIGISTNDTHYQKIVWRSNPSEPIRHFRLLTVTYGLSSASFLAIRSIKQVAEDNKLLSPQASLAIANDIYVDDLMSGAVDETSAIQLKNNIAELLSNYGFHLRKWTSNCKQILSDTPTDQKNESHKDIQDRIHHPAPLVKVLGVRWDQEIDRFIFTSQLPDCIEFTKRTVLSEASRLFDPLGWLAPVVITFKIFMQSLWAENINWDDPLPRDKHVHWVKIREDLKAISRISIPRFIQTVKGFNTDIHGFCDASQSAYAAVVFFRISDLSGKTSVQLISAKTKVSPIKQQTIPRLELCAAVLLTNLIKTVKRESSLEINEICCWIDSQIVLDWLGSHPRRWSTFIGNRTSEVLSNFSRRYWRHVPSTDNPADCASRGLSPMDLQAHTLWWNGPDWLHSSSECWPAQKNNYGHREEESSKRITNVFTCTKSTECERVMGYVYRFISNLMQSKGSRQDGIYLHRKELFHVIYTLCQHEQSQFYHEDVSALQSKGEVSKTSNLKALDPFLDDVGLLRVGGRLQNSLADYSTKHPIIIHPKSRITELILRDIHLAHKHAGPSLLLSITRQEYWIPNGKLRAKEIIKKCITCLKFKAQCNQQLMGSLPRSRVEYIRPFLKTGVDYAGPIPIHLTKGRGQKTYKAYICLFICLSIKAVHLELVGDLSSDAFLGALKRFTSRRGICLELFSDNGTNFIGADSKLQQEFNRLIKSSNNISDFFSRNRITWNFIPPSSPHFGGLWEAAIKSTKYHIKRVIGKHILSLEEMNTLLVEIEGILNSRPLCVINDTEVDPLTPSHFLIGHPITKIPEMDITHLNTSHLTRWQMVQQMSQHFWKKWHLEYLTSLQRRSKWTSRKSPIQIDDIVLIRDNNSPVNQWLLGRVHKLHPGSDGLVRVVTIKTTNNEIKRPIHKLCVLPISQEISNEV